MINPSPYPPSAENMDMIRDRIRRWDIDGELESDLPVEVGRIPQMRGLLTDNDVFRTVAGGDVVLDLRGNVADYESDSSGADILDEGAVIMATTSLFRIINSDVRHFVGIPGDDEDTKIALSFDLMAGIYTTSSSSSAHIDPMFGLGYFSSHGPSTVFLSGYFTRDEVKRLGRGNEGQPGISFDSGVVARANETNLHHAPVVDVPTPRMLARVVIKNVRNY